MNRDDIIMMAREAGWTGIYSEWSSPTERISIEVPVTMEQIERFAALVAAAEREACAKIVDRWHDGPSSEPEMAEIAAEIRARGNSEKP
jgi:hypothetical protein